MRLTLSLPAVVLTVCAALVAATMGGGVASAPPAARPPRSGMELLEAFRCRSAETKRVIVRGVEDDFSPAGYEPSFIRPASRSARTLSFNKGTAYDQSQADRNFIDSILVPTPVARGLFVIGLRPILNNDNDTMLIRDQNSDTASYMDQPGFSAAVSALDRLAGWRRLGDVRYAEFASLTYDPRGVSPSLTPGWTLLDSLRAARGERWIDVLVQDDTSVDFIGLALCLAPTDRKGLTLAPDPRPLPGGLSLLALTCQFTKDEDRVCDPYAGDTPCDTKLPVACLRPRETPMPAALAQTDAGSQWVGGEIAMTEPVAASRFATIGQVDRFCADRFGPGWRTAALHDSLSVAGLVGEGRDGPSRSRAWVDIVDQPYGVCWAR